MVVYINGVYFEETDASINVFDSCVSHGDGLFETMRAYNGKIFALDEHLNRLINSANILGIKNIPAKEILSAVCGETLSVNKLTDARIRLMVTRGAPDSTHPTVIVTTNSFSGYDSSQYEKGMSAITIFGYRNSQNPLNKIKSTSYQPMTFARRKAAGAGCDEAILINERDHITEGSYTNIFAVRGEKIYTPPVVDGLLPGIMRDFVIKIAAESGYSVLQRSISVDDAYKMDEMFLTNSLMQVMPLVKIDKKQVGSGNPGSHTQNIMGSVNKGILERLKESDFKVLGRSQ